MDGLQHIVRSETEDLQDLTDTALQQVQAMYSQAEQLFAEFSAKGKLFLQNSSTVGFCDCTSCFHPFSRFVTLCVFVPVCISQVYGVCVCIVYVQGILPFVSVRI